MRWLVMPGAIALLGMLPGSVAAQQQRGARIDTTFAFARTGTLELTVPSGDITVTGWDRDAVQIRASTATGDLRLEVSGPRLVLGAHAVRGRLGETRMEVSVPRGARVAMRSFSGGLVVRGIRGEVVADVSSGDIEASDLTGGASLTTISGDVRARGLAGLVRASTTSGNVDLTDITGQIDASATSGWVRLRGIDARIVKAGSLNGIVEFEGPLVAGGQYTFSAHAGNVHLYVPENASATFRLATFSGHVETEIPLTMSGGNLGRGGPVTFTLGGGSATVTAQAHSGNIVIRRAPRPSR